MVPKIHFETHGSGAVDVVICNGLSQSTANWRGIARQNPQFRWILYDARGCGKSGPGPFPSRLDDHVGDLLAVMDQVGSQKPLLLGFSHGARVALRAAASHGPRFLGLVLVSCAARNTVRRKAHIKAWEACLRLGGVEALAWASLPNIVGRKILEKFPDPSLIVKGTVARNNRAGLLAIFAGMADYPAVESDARRVSLATLVMRGEEDGLVEEACQHLFGQWLDNAVLETFPACGHTLPLEEPVQFVASLKRFCRQKLNRNLV